MKLKNHLKEFMQEGDVTVRQLSEHLGISTTTLQKMRDEKPTTRELLWAEIAHYFGIGFGDLFTVEEETETDEN